MCELHYYWCPACALRWQGHVKLASCEESDADKRCPERLCMYVGNPRKPRRSECGVCARTRDLLEDYAPNVGGMVSMDQVAAGRQGQNRIQGQPGQGQGQSTGGGPALGLDLGHTRSV